MDVKIKDEILQDSFEYYMKFSDRPTAEKIGMKKRIIEKTKGQLFDKLPVIKINNILEDISLARIKHLMSRYMKNVSKNNAIKNNGNSKRSQKRSKNPTLRIRSCVPKIDGFSKENKDNKNLGSSNKTLLQDESKEKNYTCNNISRSSRRSSNKNSEFSYFESIDDAASESIVTSVVPIEKDFTVDKDFILLNDESLNKAGTNKKTGFQNHVNKSTKSFVEFTAKNTIPSMIPNVNDSAESNSSHPVEDFILDNDEYVNQIVNNSKTKNSKNLIKASKSVLDFTAKTSELANNLSSATSSKLLSGNLVSVKMQSQKKTKGTTINIKLPVSLQYRSNHMPLHIELDLTKLNFSQCIQQHSVDTQNDETSSNFVPQNTIENELAKSNKKITSIKRKNNSSNQQNKRIKTTITSSKNHCNSDDLREFYETFNDLVEENDCENNSIVPSTSNNQQNTNENACQYPRIDTTSGLEFHNQIIQIGSMITNENGQIIITLPENQTALSANVVNSASIEIQPDQLSSPIIADVLQKEYPIISLVNDSFPQTRDNSIQRTKITQVELRNTTDNANVLSERTDVPGFKISSEQINAEAISSFLPTLSKASIKEVSKLNCSEPEKNNINKGDGTSMNKYKNMPLLDDPLDENEVNEIYDYLNPKIIKTIAKVTNKDKNNNSADERKKIPNLVLKNQVENANNNTNKNFNERNVSQKFSTPILNNDLNVSLTSLYQKKDVEHGKNDLATTSFKEDDIPYINPHKVIDDLLNGIKEPLDFEANDDTLTLCCSPNIFEGIDIPNIKTVEVDKLSQEKNELTSIEKADIPNIKTVEVDKLSQEKNELTSIEKDDFYLEDYSNHDIFGIPRTRNKYQIQENSVPNINKTFKIPKLSNTSSTSNNSQIIRCSSVTEIDDPRPVRPCWPNNPTNIARPPPNYRVDISLDANSETNKAFDDINPQIAQVFDKPCFNFLKNCCAKGTNCRFRHTFLEPKEVKERVLLFGEQYVISSYHFIKRHEKLFHYYFLIFCEIFTEKKQLNMLRQMIKDCTVFAEGLYYMRTLIKFLREFGKSKCDALNIVLKTIEGIPNLSNIIIDIISDADVILYNLNILRFYIQSSYKFETRIINKLATSYLNCPNEELCRIILDILLNTAASELANDKSEDLIKFLEGCKSMDTNF